MVIVLFGGDGQSHYLADTWIFDLKTRAWRQSRSASGPEARAGHFAVFDPGSGWVIAGGGYNRRDLSDMWAYDAAQDRWRPWPESAGRILSLGGPRAGAALDCAGHGYPHTWRPMTCNVLYPVRTTYGYRIVNPPSFRTARALAGSHCETRAGGSTRRGAGGCRARCRAGGAAAGARTQPLDRTGRTRPRCAHTHLGKRDLRSRSAPHLVLGRRALRI